VYKGHSSAKSARAYLNDVAKQLATKFPIIAKSRRYQNGTPTFGDVLFVRDGNAKESKELFRFLEKSEWIYLCELNNHVNYALHNVSLPIDAQGKMKMNAPADHCKVPLLQSVAKKVGLVNEKKDLVVTTSEENSSDSSTTSTPERKGSEASSSGQSVEGSAGGERKKRGRHR